MKLDKKQVLIKIGELGISNTELAKKADVSGNTVVAARNGRQVTPQTAAAIAKALGLRLEDIISEV